MGEVYFSSVISEKGPIKEPHLTVPEGPLDKHSAPIVQVSHYHKGRAKEKTQEQSVKAL